MAGDHVDQPVPNLATLSSVDGGVSGGVANSVTDSGVGKDAGGVSGDAALDLGYTVTVDSFSGPLDLLLYLVRRTELDILEVPLSLIIDQFVETIRSWQDADLDVAGDFILMAATLLELKARTIVPPVEEDEATDDREPAFDPRQSLLRSLLAYRRFKEAAQCLDRLEEDRRFHVQRQFREAIPEAPPEEGDFDLGELDLNIVMTTCERLMARIGGLGPRTVMVDEQPLGVRIAAMLDALAVCQRATIRELLAGSASRVLHITTVMASLELARQRLVEIEQPEQFGEVALRLRTTEEREREPELPPEETPGPKRRRRLPLVTFSAASLSTVGDDEVDASALEEPTESDETRFLRELEEATRVTAVLAITADVEKSFTAHWLTLHPELVPVALPPPEVPVAETPPTKTFPAKKVTQPSAPVSPLLEAPAAVSEPTAEVAVVSPAGGENAPLASENNQLPITVDSVVVESVTVEPAIAAEVVDAGASVTDFVISPQVEIITSRHAASASPTSALVEEVAVITAESPSLPLVEEAPSTLALAPELLASELLAPELAPETLAEEKITTTERFVAVEVEVNAPAAPAEVVNHAEHQAEPIIEPERVLDVEAWPVMRALPMPEETVDPLADLTSDDPAEVNARLHGHRPNEEPETDDDDERDELDPDDLLGDDPAMVNAALQAATARIPLPPRVLPELIIPTATETTTWTAPIDVGQTAASEPSDDSDDSELSEEPDIIAASSLSEVVSDKPAVVSTPALVDEETHAPVEKVPESPREERVDALVVPVVTEQLFANDVSEVVSSVPLPTTQALASAVIAQPSFPLVSNVTSDPMPTTAPLILAELADEPVTGVTAHVSLTIPLVEEAAVSAVIAEPSFPSVSKVTSDPTPTTAPLILAESADEPVTEVTIKIPRKILPVIASVELSQPPAALVLVSVGAVGASVPSEVAAPPLSESESEPPPPPPPPSPPPSSPSPSPRIALTSNPSPTRPMSTPPRSKAWLMIALIAAINLLWAGWTWFAWVPKNVVEIVASPQSMMVLSAENNGQANVHEATLIWRFNVDVVDELGVSQATAMPDIVPQVTPAIAGLWHWRDRRTLALKTSEALPLATTFTAVFSAEKFRTTDGFRLRESTTNSWSTAALSLSAATVETFDRDGTIIALTFNQPVDPTVIAGGLSVVLPPVEAQPVTVVAPPSPQPIAETTTEPAIEPKKAEVTNVPATTPTPPLVRALSTAPATTVRVVIRSATRGSATIGLKAGTVGSAGPLGLAQAWEQVVPLQQTLVLNQATTSVPSHGAVRVDVTTSDAKAPLDLLAPTITVDPALPVSVKITDTGLSVVGDFQPGQTYRIHSAAVWPDEPLTSGHVLPAYSAASSVSVVIPARPAGIWLLDDAVAAGDVRVAAHAVATATASVLALKTDESLATNELAWDSLGDAPARLKIDDLAHDLAPASYRLRINAKDDATILCEEKLVIEHVMVRPEALMRAVITLAKAIVAGDQQSDVPVRVVRLERP